MPRQLFITLIATSAATTAAAQPIEIGPTLDPAGAITVVTLYGADADPGAAGWSPIPDSRALRATGPGRPLTYHVIIPDDPLVWKLGITARSLSQSAPSTRFEITVNDQPFTALSAAPAADTFTTHWTPLGEFTGLVALTITPTADGENWQGIDIGAIQLARRNGTESTAEGSGSNQPLTRPAAPLETGKNSGGGGGGGGSPQPQDEFPELTDPPLDDPEPDEPLEDIVETPTPDPTPPSPPDAPPPRPSDDPSRGVPAPTGVALALLAFAAHQRRR